MKKLFLSLVAILLSVHMFAVTYTDKVSITIYDGTYYPSLIVGESADAEFAGNVLVNGYYAPVQNIASMPLAIYAYRGGVEYENLILSSLENIPMGIKTSNATSYTLYFAGLQGAVSIYDKQEDEWIDCSAAYPFTIDGSLCNSYINNRFYFFYNAADFAYSLTTNAYGWASYSNTDVNLMPTVPAGLKIYKGAINGDVLDLTVVDHVAANQGVIVKGAPNTTYYFAAGSGSASFADNDLKPASAWASHTGSIFCLKGDALYEYVGSDMPANKAYLEISGSSAPKRISLRFNEEQGIEDVKAGVQAEKFVENGQIFIKRGEAVYNMQGQIVK